MIAITKEERGILAQRLPNVHVVRTMKQKSKRHHYFCEESRRALRLLAEIRASSSLLGWTRQGGCARSAAPGESRT